MYGKSYEIKCNLHSFQFISTKEKITPIHGHRQPLYHRIQFVVTSLFIDRHRIARNL